MLKEIAAWMKNGSNFTEPYHVDKSAFHKHEATVFNWKICLPAAAKGKYQMTVAIITGLPTVLHSDVFSFPPVIPFLGRCPPFAKWPSLEVVSRTQLLFTWRARISIFFSKNIQFKSLVVSWFEDMVDCNVRKPAASDIICRSQALKTGGIWTLNVDVLLLSLLPATFKRNSLW